MLTLELSYSLDVNALNFCRFSLLTLDVPPPPSAADTRALVAVPNLVESSLASASPPFVEKKQCGCDDDHFD